MVEMNRVLAIISSAAVALLYTLFGQMVSVAYTNVLQFVCVVGGLVRFHLCQTQKCFSLYALLGAW